MRQETFLKWIRAEAEAADGATGRGVRITPKQIAARIDMSERTVQTCRAAARQLGLLVDVVAGRRLSFVERLEAHANGSKQRGLANESCLTVPSWLRPHLPHHEHQAATVERSHGSSRRPRRAVDNRPNQTRKSRSHLPRCTPPSGSTGPTCTSPSPVVTPTTFATSATERARTPGATPAPRTGRGGKPRAGLRLAQALTARVPWLRETTRPGNISTQLAKFEQARLPWTAADIIAALDATNQRLGWTSLTTEHIRTTGHAVLARYLEDLDVDADHPRLHHELAADERRAEQARHAERATKQAQKSSPNADYTAAKAQLRSMRR